MSTSLLSPSEASSSSSISTPSQLEPFQSAAFRHMRTRMQTLSTPPDVASKPVTEQLRLAAHKLDSPAAASRSQTRRQSSTTPSPPASESATPPESASASNTPLTQASDSSASSSCTPDNATFRRQATASPTFAFRAQPPAVIQRAPRVSPSLSNKRVLSEGEVILPRPAKKIRMPFNSTHRKRSCGAFQTSTFVPSAPAITSWRKACDQRRQRQHAKRSKPASASGETATVQGQQAQAGLSAATGSAVLPELRLLSATRTAPIGWSHFPGASTFIPHKVEAYDESAAKSAPERQRFWPIIDHQLDYTGARMLSLSNTHAHPSSDARHLIDAPISPKSCLPLPQCGAPFPLQQHPCRAACRQPTGSSDEDRSPLTPQATARFAATRSSPRHASQYGRDAVENESRRRPKIALSPAATLSAVIDFTRAQASQKEQQQGERNAYGQLIYSPPSPAEAVEDKSDLAVHAPLRIAPLRSTAAATDPASDLHRSSDYFGHWETYLCNFGKESTF